MDLLINKIVICK